MFSCQTLRNQTLRNQKNSTVGRWSAPYALGLALGMVTFATSPANAYDCRLAVAGHCHAMWYGNAMDDNFDYLPNGSGFFSDWGGGGGNPAAGQIIADNNANTQVNVWCNVPDTYAHPKWNIAGWNVQGYNNPDSFSDFAEACVKFWNGTGWSCTAEIVLPNYNYAYNIMADSNYASDPVWTSSTNQNNFAFLYVVLGSSSQYYGDYFWGT